MPGKLPPYQRDYIIQLLALGNTADQISEKVREKYDRPLALSTVYLIKRQKADQIAEAQNSIATSREIIAAPLIRQKSYRRLNRRLDKTEADETKIDQLRKQWQAGEINEAKFHAEVVKYEVMSTNELIKMADMSHTHARQGSEDEPLTAADQAALSLLVEGLKSGNPMQLIQVLNPKVYPNGENPVPPVDIPSPA